MDMIRAHEILSIMLIPSEFGCAATDLHGSTRMSESSICTEPNR